MASVEFLERSRSEVPMQSDQYLPSDDCMHFTINRHASDMLELLNGFRCSNKLCDIRLRAESETFPAHRVVLSAASPYFNAMFCNNMIECGMTEVPLHGVKAEVLSAVIEFAYSSKASIHKVLMMNKVIN